MKLKGLNRIEVLVSDPDKAEADFDALLGGLNFSHEDAAQGHDLDCRIEWNAGIELVHPRDKSHILSPLLENKGEHIFTVVWEVENLEDAKTWVTSKGFDIMYEYDHGHSDDGFHVKQISISPQRTHGVLVTLIERTRVSG